MNKSKFKYLLSLFTLSLCVNFLLFTTGSIYLNQSTLTYNQTQNGPQKRSFNSGHNFQIKLQSENDEKNVEVEEEIEEEKSLTFNFSKNYFNIFNKTVAFEGYISNRNKTSRPYYFTSLNALYIVFRVFRL